MPEVLTFLSLSAKFQFRSLSDNILFNLGLCPKGLKIQCIFKCMYNSTSKSCSCEASEAGVKQPEL